MNFDAVWVVGVVEGSVPPPPKDDPLLPEDEWLAAGGPPLLAERRARQHFDFLSALATAPRRTFSYPATDPRAEAPGISPRRGYWNRRRRWEGDSVTSDSLLRLKRPWLSITASLEDSLSGLEEPADRHDYDLQRLLLWRREHPSSASGGSGAVPHPLVKDGPLAKAAHMILGRAGGALSEFDGNLSSVAPDSGFARDLGRYPLSPTSLEAWAVCPFRYFLGHVLHLSALDDPQEETTISRLNSGSLVHEILERFIGEARNAGTLPVSETRLER